MKNNTLNYKNLEIKNLPDSVIEINCTVDAEFLNSYKSIALKEIQKNADLPGFRKGQIPEKVLISKFGEFGILEETAELIIGEIYPKILDEKKIMPISRPRIELKKLAIGNDLEFTITTTVMPEIDIPDYKKIASEILKKPLADLEIAEKELEEAILNIRKMYAEKSKKTGDTSEAELPELTEDFVKKIGNFTTIDDFKNRVKEGMLKEKEDQNNEKRRLEILDEIIKNSKTITPKILVESELNKMMGQFKDDVQNSNLKFEDYLKEIGKTEEELRKEWEGPAEKRAKTQVIVSEIARIENLRPDHEEIHKFTHMLMEQYKGVDHKSAEIYADIVLTNKKVIEFLESHK